MAEMGRIGDVEKRVGERITVGLVQTLYKCARQVFLDIDGFNVVLF